MSKKVLITLLTFTLMFSSLTYAKEKEREETTPGSAIFVMATPKDVKITTQSIKLTKDEGSIEITYPKILGLEDEELEATINRMFKQKGEYAYKEMMKQMEQTEDKVPYQLIRNFNVKSSLPHLLVIGEFEYCYVGGNCGYARQNYVTVDLNANKILTLKDLFANTDYKMELKSAISKQIQGRTQNLIITGDEVFYINEKGDLVLVFNLSDVETYGSGILEFIVERECIKDYLVNL